MLTTFNYTASLALPMHCSHCEKCCQATEMELCEADIARLEQAGYRRRDFSSRGKEGIPRLRNVGEYCYFYDHELKRCKEYACRPLGCEIYPVNMSVDGEILVDGLCPECGTLTSEEVETKGWRLRELLNTISLEARQWLRKD